MAGDQDCLSLTPGALLLVPTGLQNKHKQSAGLTHTGQGVAKLGVMDELPVIEPRHTVQVETVQTNHMAVVALENQDRAPAKTAQGQA